MGTQSSSGATVLRWPMMLKRTFDIVAAASGLVFFSPVLAATALLIWLQDWHSPFYLSPRTARGGGMFLMVKFRSMVVNADRIGASSTAATDPRITRIGRLVRRCKLDEMMQMWNVLKGDMSFVGPRPQIPWAAQLYTEVEKRILTVRPGITDPSSIVFADEGDVLQGSSDPDQLYNQIIRPWKSRMALAYIDHRSFWTDIWLIVLSVIGIPARPIALRGVEALLRRWQVDALVIQMASRRVPLLAYAPPGACVDQINS